MLVKKLKFFEKNKTEREAFIESIKKEIEIRLENEFNEQAEISGRVKVFMEYTKSVYVWQTL